MEGARPQLYAAGFLATAPTSIDDMAFLVIPMMKLK
jgi:hypothetical protein